jgi:ATP-binding cassette subfamily B protein
MGVSVGLEVFAALAAMVQLFLAKRLLDQLRVAGEVGRFTGELRGTIIAIAGLTALTGAAASIQTFMRPLLSELVQRDSLRRVLTRLRSCDLEEFDDPAFHNRLDRIATEGVDRPVELIWAFVAVFSGVLGLVTINVVLASLLPEVVPMVLLASIPLAITGRLDALAYRDYIARITPLRRSTRYLRDLLVSRRAAAELLGYGLRPHLEARHDELQLRRIAEMRRMVKARGLRSLGSAVIVSVVAVVALMLIASRTATGRLTISEAVTIAIATQQLASRMQSLRYGLATVHQNRIFLDDLTSFVDGAPAHTAVADSLSEEPVPARAAVSVRVDHVSFTYPGQPVAALHDIDLRIDAGQIIALVGENGSGKTTLAKLIAGLYSPGSGRVLVDGIDVRTMPRSRRTTHAATVFQDFARYAVSARENVGFGDVARLEDHDAVRAAATLGGLDPIIARLPDGEETVLASEYDRGADLSAGQWQRVALARAFFRDAPLLVLDEPTAALDARAEYELFERVRLLSRGRTVILISHRLRTVRSADRIVVLRAGRLIESGTHAELVTAGGLYAELDALQERTAIGDELLAAPPDPGT